jgi:hyperosmotically inducible protein
MKARGFEEKGSMFKKFNAVSCGLAVVLMTAGAASAQSATQETKAKTNAAAHKTGAAMSDAEITSAVKSKLLADKTVGGLKIDVDTDNHIVSLSGQVKSSAERARALQLARNTSGVKSVVDKLTVGGTAPTTGRVVEPK